MSMVIRHGAGRGAFLAIALAAAGCAPPAAKPRDAVSLAQALARAGSWAEREELRIALAELGEGAREAIPSLRGIVVGPDDGPRQAAFLAAFPLERDAEARIRLLLAMLGAARDPGLRLWCGAVLSNQAQADPDAVLRALESSEPRIQRLAVEALAGDVPYSVGLLREIVARRIGDAGIRDLAGQAIEGVGPDPPEPERGPIPGDPLDSIRARP